MSRSHTTLTVSLAILVLAILGLPAPAQDAPAFELERLLPADSMAVISVPDVDAVRKAFGRTAIAKIFRDEEVRELIGPLVGMLDERLATLKKDEGVDVVDLLDCLRGQVAVALVDIDHAKGTPRPLLVLAIDARANRDRLLGFIGRGKMALQRQNERLKFSDRKRGEIDVTSIDDDGMTIEAAFVGTACVITLHPDAMNAVLDAHAAGAAAKGLVGSTRWTASMKPVSGAGVPFLRGYVNVGRIFEKYADGIAPVKAWLEESGVLGIQAVSFTTTIEGAEFVDRVHVHGPAEKRGLFKLVPQAALSDELLRRIPKDAMYASVGQMDLGAIWDEVFRVLEASDKGVHAKATKGLAQLEEVLGLSIRKELVATIGGDLVAYALPPMGGGPIPEVVIELALKDRAAFAAAFEKCLAAAQAQSGDAFALDSIEFRGQRIHCAKVDGLPVAPSYTFVGDRLVVALNPNTIKGVIRQGEVEGKSTSILDSERFVAARARLPRGSSSLEYYDLATIFEYGYNLATPFLRAAGGSISEKIPISMAALPSAEAISQHLTPVIVGLRADDVGMTTTMASPVPLVPVFVGLTVGSSLFFAATAGEPAAVEFEPAPRSVDAPAAKSDADIQNLDQIGAALLIYYVGHAKTYPANLAVLVEREDLARKSLRSPSDDSPTKIGDVEISYDYIGPDVARLDTRDRTLDPARIVMVWSRTTPRAVTFLNGSARRVEEEEFQRLLVYTRTMIGSAKSK